MRPRCFLLSETPRVLALLLLRLLISASCLIHGLCVCVHSVFVFVKSAFTLRLLASQFAFTLQHFSWPSASSSHSPYTLRQMDACVNSKKIDL